MDVLSLLLLDIQVISVLLIINNPLMNMVYIFYFLMIKPRITRSKGLIYNDFPESMIYTAFQRGGIDSHF